MKRRAARPKATAKSRRRRAQGGRPTKFTPARQQEFCELIFGGLSRSAAARMIGCTPSGAAKALQRDRCFATMVAQVEQQNEQRRLATLRALASPRDREHIDKLKLIRRGKLEASAAGRHQSARLEEVLAQFVAAHLGADSQHR